VLAARTRSRLPADARAFAPGKRAALLPEGACAHGAHRAAAARVNGDDGAALSAPASGRYGVGGLADHEPGRGAHVAWLVGRCAWPVVDVAAPGAGGPGLYSYARARQSASGRVQPECEVRGLLLPVQKHWEQRLPVTGQAAQKGVGVSSHREVELFSYTQRSRLPGSCVENVAIPLLFSCTGSRRA